VAWLAIRAPPIGGATGVAEAPIGPEVATETPSSADAATIVAILVLARMAAEGIGQHRGIPAPGAADGIAISSRPTKPS
jgi:hypothetical protein